MPVVRPVRLVGIKKISLAVAVVELEANVAPSGEQASARRPAALLEKAAPPDRGSIEFDLAAAAGSVRYSVNQEAPSDAAEFPYHMDL